VKDEIDKIVRFLDPVKEAVAGMFGREKKEYEAEKTKRMIEEADASKVTLESARKKLDDIRRQLKDKINFN